MHYWWGFLIIVSLCFLKHWCLFVSSFVVKMWLSSHDACLHFQHWIIFVAHKVRKYQFNFVINSGVIATISLVRQNMLWWFYFVEITFTTHQRCCIQWNWIAKHKVIKNNKAHVLQLYNILIHNLALHSFSDQIIIHSNHPFFTWVAKIYEC